MPRKPKKRTKYKKKIDRIQKKIEKEELKQIQEGYKTQVPAFIWVLKIVLIFGIVTALLSAFRYSGDTGLVLQDVVAIVISLIFLYGLLKRKVWSWYLGLVVFAAGMIVSILESRFVYTLLGIVFFILLYWHRDYLNKR